MEFAVIVDTVPKKFPFIIFLYLGLCFFFLLSIFSISFDCLTLSRFFFSSRVHHVQ